MIKYLTNLIEDMQQAAKNLPARIAYETLVNYFDKSINWVSEGVIGVEFCEYDTKNCPFPAEYCMCKDFENDINTDADDFEPDTENNSGR